MSRVTTFTPDGRRIDRNWAKWCPRCQTVLPFTAFAFRNIEKMRWCPHCRTCQRSLDTARYRILAQRVELKEKARRWREQNPGVKTGLNRLWKFGITPEEFEQMSRSQEGRCASCRSVPDDALNVDHCHASGQIRGLLCSKCNLGLGMFDDSPERLRLAAGYLEGSRVC